MLRRWILYLAVWSGCLTFYYAYREWLSWIVLVAITLLPLFSLLISLPAMLLAKMQVNMPPCVTAGTPLSMVLTLHAPMPLPRWRVRILAVHSLTGKRWLLQPGGGFPTEHCGALDCKISRSWIYDYLGLFRLPVKAPPAFRVILRPRPVRPDRIPDVERYLSAAWRPKPGGGFSENHELRLYRPGDNLRQIHWKLSSKTGNLVFREPMEPNGSRALLWLSLSGDADLLDKKLGQLLWLSGYLQRRGLKHDILAYTGQGPQTWHIGSRHTLLEAMDALLGASAMADNTLPIHRETAAWQHYIGGDDYETP